MKNERQNGGSAFPCWDSSAVHRIGMAAIMHIEDTAERDKAYTLATADAAQGLTKRDYFAAKAMQAQLTAFWALETHHGWSLDEIAQEAYAMADAMLNAREA